MISFFSLAVQLFLGLFWSPLFAVLGWTAERAMAFREACFNSSDDRSSANDAVSERAHDYDGAYAGVAVGEFGDLGAAGVAA